MRCAQRAGRYSRAGYRKWLGAGIVLAVQARSRWRGMIGDRKRQRAENISMQAVVRENLGAGEASPRVEMGWGRCSTNVRV